MRQIHALPTLALLIAAGFGASAIASEDRRIPMGTPEAPLIGPAPTGQPASRLHSVEVHPRPSGTAVKLVGDGGFQYSTFGLENPRRFVMDLAGVVSEVEPYSVSPERGTVRRVRAAQHRVDPQPVSRVVFDLGAAAAPTVESLPDGARVFFPPAKTSEAKQAQASNPKVAAAPTAQPPAPGGTLFVRAAAAQELPAPVTQVAQVQPPTAPPLPEESDADVVEVPQVELEREPPATEEDVLGSLAAGRQRAAAAYAAQGPMDEELIDAVADYAQGEPAREIQRSTVTQVPFGHSQPLLTCTPDRACDIELQAGEQIYGVASGAPDKWTIQQLVSGNPSAPIPHVIVQPAGYGLSTNLIIGTDRRTYRLGLHSPARAQVLGQAGRGEASYVRALSFYYPDDLVHQWTTAREMLQRQARLAADTRSKELSLGVGVDGLNFNYEIDPSRKARKKASWVPKAVYDDGTRTYIQMPHDYYSTSVPTLVIERGKESVVPNFHYVPENRTIVVHTVFNKAVMFEGTGRKRIEVDIERLR